MTIRVPVSNPEISWHDQQQVNQEDVALDQSHHDLLRAATINNHFGSGVLLNSLDTNILFDSSILDETQLSLLSSGLFDGSPINVTKQPFDINLGNQIAITLTDSNVYGRESVKIAIIGLNFQGDLQIDKFYFHKNETQITSKHYIKILCVFFNDFLGNSHCSKILGGKIIIRETLSLEFSRDPIMASQDLSPDLFWRDFKRADLSLSLLDTIQEGIGSEYDVSSLNVDVIGLDSKQLVFEDVTSQVGQKFLAKTNNLQKITLLLGVAADNLVDESNKFDWTGDLVISIYSLQTANGSCPSKIIPNLAIEFDPSAIPIEQLSYNKTALSDLGYVLTDILQPVDFVFNSTSLGKVGSVIIDNYYAIVLKRSGSNTSGTILIGNGTNKLEDSRVILFGGNSWVDISDEDLWFQVWTDAVKIADGQMYDAGNGCLYSKTKKDKTTSAEIDNQEKFYNFSSTGENTLNIGVVQAILDGIANEQDEKTGNPVISKKQFLPALSLLTESKFAELQQTSEPVSVGCILDTNPKLNPILNKTQNYIGLAKGNIFCIVNPDSDLLSLNLLGSKLIPDSDCCSQEYKIAKTILCTDGYGDLNGDGIIDQIDVTKLSELIGESLFLESTQQKILDGYIETLELLKADLDGDGYITSNDLDLITQYFNKSINSFPVGSSFNHMCLYLEPAIGRNDGYFDCDDGYVRLDGYIESDLINSSDLNASELIFDGYEVFPDLLTDNPALSAIPFLPVSFQIKPLPFWQDYLLLANSETRYVPCTFTYPDKLTPTNCEINPSLCLDKNDILPTCDPGRNDFFVPDNLYIGGSILNKNGSIFKQDLEIIPIVLILPEIPLTEVSINIFEKLVAESSNGKTIAQFDALKYSDCSFVQLEDISLNKIRFEAAIQSISWNLDGYVSDGYDEGFSIVVNPGVGIYLDQTNGILTINAADLNLDPIFQTLSTKIQVVVYLKKSGWNNQPITILADQISGLISS